MSQQTVIRNQAKPQLPQKLINSEKRKKQKEVGLVVSQQTVIRNQAELSSLKKSSTRPNGRQIRNLQVKISLSPNFGAERTLIDPISVTSKFHIFQRFLGFKLISSINDDS